MSTSKRKPLGELADELKYCALCVNKTETVWSLTQEGETALVPLCEEHEPQLARLWNLCRENTASVKGEPRRKRLPSRPRPLEFTPLQWEPPEG